MRSRVKYVKMHFKAQRKNTGFRLRMARPDTEQTRLADSGHHFVTVWRARAHKKWKKSYQQASSIFNPMYLKCLLYTRKIKVSHLLPHHPQTTPTSNLVLAITLTPPFYSCFQNPAMGSQRWSACRRSVNIKNIFELVLTSRNYCPVYLTLSCSNLRSFLTLFTSGRVLLLFVLFVKKNLNLETTSYFFLVQDLKKGRSKQNSSA